MVITREEHLRSIYRLYVNVLKYGFTPSLYTEKRDEFYITTTGINPDWNDFTEDWQFHELPFVRNNFHQLEAEDEWNT